MVMFSHVEFIVAIYGARTGFLPFQVDVIVIGQNFLRRRGIELSGVLLHQLCQSIPLGARRVPDVVVSHVPGLE